MTTGTVGTYSLELLWSLREWYTSDSVSEVSSTYLTWLLENGHRSYCITSNGPTS